MTHRERQLLDFIRHYQMKNRGVSPSFDDMVAALSLHSKSGVFRLLQALEEQGRISRGHNRHRRITILSNPDFADMTDRAFAEEARRRGFALVKMVDDKMSAEDFVIVT